MLQMSKVRPTVHTTTLFRWLKPCARDHPASDSTKTRQCCMEDSAGQACFEIAYDGTEQIVHCDIPVLILWVVPGFDFDEKVLEYGPSATATMTQVAYYVK